MVVVATRDKSIFMMLFLKVLIYIKKSTLRRQGLYLKVQCNLLLAKRMSYNPQLNFCLSSAGFDNNKNAEIIKEGVELALASTTCVSCNLTLREVVEGFSKTDRRLEAGKDGEKFIMCTNLALNTEIPYAESTCHPQVIPKYTMVKRIVRGIAHVITLQQFGGRWPTFKRSAFLVVTVQELEAASSDILSQKVQELPSM